MILIYKTTNLINNKIYVGQHASNNINDNYLGSGIALKNALKKYGKENFKREILYIVYCEEEANLIEADIVDEDFIKSPNTYNICIGGDFHKGRRGQIIARRKHSNEKFHLILKDDYNSTDYETPCSGKLNIIDSEGNIKRILVEDYDTKKHKTPSSERVSVRCKITGKSKSISVNDYDDSVHKKVFGGKVSIIDGKAQYVSKKSEVDGIHKNKVTCIDLLDGKCKHVDKKEFNNTRWRYKHNTEDYATGRCNLTGKKKRFKCVDIDDNVKKKYRFSTNGKRTVFDIKTRRFTNINKEDFDKNKHKLSSDKKFSWYNAKDNIRLYYWGSKKDFIKQYNIPESFWNKLLNNSKIETTSKKYEKWLGSHLIKIINWKDKL